MDSTHCVISNCRMSIIRKPAGVSFHSFPVNTTHEIRNKWIQTLKNRCTKLDWTKSKICSLHFEKKYMDPQKKLKENAVPTLFPNIAPINTVKNKNMSPVMSKSAPRTKVDRLLCRRSQAEMAAEVKTGMAKLREPTNLDIFITDDLKCKNDAPLEARLWLMIKKQNHLNGKLMEQIAQNKRHMEYLQKNLDDARSSKKDAENNLDGLKYIVKSLQEKHATLEEQIEILTAVESR